MSKKVFPPILLPNNVRPTKYDGYYCSDRGEVYRIPEKRDNPEDCNSMGLIQLKGHPRGNPIHKKYMYLGYSISLRDSQGKFIRQKKVNGHRLVAETFIPNPEEYEVIDHIDRNKSNNHVSNLRWCTQFENSTSWKRDEKFLDNVSQSKRSFIYDVGINDSKIRSQKNAYYNRWAIMIRNSVKNNQDLYEDWKYLSNYEKWASNTLKEGDQIFFKKDVMIGPDTAIVLPNGAGGNLTLTPSKNGYPFGVSAIARQKGTVYMARGREYLGTFNTIEEAHLVWQQYKIRTLEALKKDLMTQASIDYINDIINVLKNDIINGRETKYLIKDESWNTK
jgi:hypothetical protein